MRKKHFIGVDNGTQSTRISIFDETGKLVSLGVCDNGEMISENPGWAQHDPDVLWGALVKASKEALSNFDGDMNDIVAVGLSSQRTSICMLDENGKPLMPHISWLDSRLALEMNVEGIPADLVPLAYYSKANWLSINKPDLYQKVHKYTTVSGWLTHKFTGNYKDSYANQLGAWPIDYETCQWYEDPAVAHIFGMRPDQLCEIVGPTDLLGNITQEISEELGYPAGIPVIATGGDKQCEVLGAGGLNTGDAYLTFGTLAGIEIVGEKLVRNPAFHTILGCVPGKLNYEASVMRGFWTVSWFRDQLSKDLFSKADQESCSPEKLLNDEAADVPAGSGGLLVIPEWYAPTTKPNAKGMMIGFDDRHTRGHIFKALLEGIVFAIKENLETILKETGIEINEIVVGGGGSKSNIAMQATADILGVEVIRAGNAETTSLGACIAAAVGAGVYANLEEATKSMSNRKEKFSPIPENQKVYDTIYEDVFKKVYPQMEGLLKTLADSAK